MLTKKVISQLFVKTVLVRLIAFAVKAMIINQIGSKAMIYASISMNVYWEIWIIVILVETVLIRKEVIHVNVLMVTLVMVAIAMISMNVKMEAMIVIPKMAFA